MWEFAASEFDSLMGSRQAFKRVRVDPLTSGGSVVLGVEQQSYTDGNTTVMFTSSAGSMQLAITRRVNGKTVTLLNQAFFDFGSVRETLTEHLGV